MELIMTSTHVDIEDFRAEKLIKSSPQILVNEDTDTNSIHILTF